MKPFGVVIRALALINALAFAACLAACAPKGPRLVAQNVPSLKNVQARDCESEAEAQKAIALFEEALAEYPKTLQGVIKLDAVYICGYLKSYSTEVSGTAVRQGSKTSLYVNAAFANEPQKLLRALHHEIFHALEFERPVDAKEWAKLNPAGYLSENPPPDGIVRYAPGEVPQEPGFISDYARFSAREDRAELFSVLMLPRKYTRAEAQRLGSDALLAEKISFIREYLKSLFGEDIIGGKTLLS